MFEKIGSIDEINKIIKEEQFTFLYISHKNCSVCHSLKPQIAKILADFPMIRQTEMDAIEVPEVAGEFSALTVPVLLLFVEGKEYLRKARFVNTREFADEVAKIVTGVLA